MYGCRICLHTGDFYISLVIFCFYFLGCLLLVGFLCSILVGGQKVINDLSKNMIEVMSWIDD